MAKLRIVSENSKLLSTSTFHPAVVNEDDYYLTLMESGVFLAPSNDRYHSQFSNISAMKLHGTGEYLVECVIRKNETSISVRPDGTYERYGICSWVRAEDLSPKRNKKEKRAKT